MVKRFCGGDGCEVARITKDYNGTQYLICTCNDLAMREVSKEEFTNFFESMENVTANSWNKEWRREYVEMRRFLYE